MKSGSQDQHDTSLPLTPLHDVSSPPALSANDKSAQLHDVEACLHGNSATRVLNYMMSEPAWTAIQLQKCSTTLCRGPSARQLSYKSAQLHDVEACLHGNSATRVLNYMMSEPAWTAIQLQKCSTTLCRGPSARQLSYKSAQLHDVGARLHSNSTTKVLNYMMSEPVCTAIQLQKCSTT